MRLKEYLPDKFKHIYEVISREDFLKDSLAGENRVYISAYDPKQELEVRKSIHLLKNKLSNLGLSVLELNLFQISYNLLNNNKLRGGVLEYPSFIN